MATTDAKPVPIKNQTHRVYVEFRDADEEIITGWTGADSKKSLDGASLVDCTNELTEVGSSGHGYIELTATAMNTSHTKLKCTITSTGAVPATFDFYPVEDGDIPVNLKQVDDQAAGASGSVDFDQIATLIARLGTPSDKGDGATVAGMLTSIAGTGFDKLTHSLVLILQAAGGAGAGLSADALARLQAILLSAGSSDESMAANLVSSPLSPSDFDSVGAAGLLKLYRGSPVTHDIKGLGPLDGATKIWVAGKEKIGDATGSEIFKIVATYDGANNELTNALIVSAKGSPLASDNASIQVLDWDVGDIRFTIKSVEAARYTPFSHDQGRYAAQYSKDNETPEPKQGRFIVVPDVIQETN